jgi:hypothetical protein
MCHPAPTASADARLAGLRAEVCALADALADVDVSELSEGSLGTTMSDLMRVRRQLEGTVAALATRFRGSSEWSADGARDPIAWLRVRGGEGFGAAREVMTRSAECAAFPAMGAALRDGSVSARHLRMLGEVAAKFPRLRTHLQSAQEHIVGLARVSEPPRFRRELIALCYRLDPDGARDDVNDRERDYYFHASTLMDGDVRVDGMLPAEVGQLLIAALESARRQVADEPSADGARDASCALDEPALWDSTTTTGVATVPADGIDVFGTTIAATEAPPDPIDVRALGQRNVEALQRILVTATGPDGGLASVAGQRPQVNVTVSIDTLAADPRSGEAVDCGWLERFGVPSQPLTVDTAQRLACDATLRPLVVDADGQLVVFGSASRVIPPSMRALVVRRDRHCRFAGCRARIDEVHHVVFYSRGGPTRSDNLLGLCWHHHHLVHEGGWSVVGDANVEVKGTGPDGRMWVTGPPDG